MSVKGGMNEHQPVGWCVDPAKMARAFPQLRWEFFGSSGIPAMRTELENRRSLLSLVPIRYVELPALARQGWIRPLDVWFTEKEMARYAPEAVALATVDGRLYAIPDDITPFVFYVHKTILDRLGLEPPRTWDQVEAFAARFLEKEGRMLVFPEGGEGIRLGFLLSLLGANGVKLLGNSRELLKDPPLLSMAYEWVRRLTRERKVLSHDRLVHPRSIPRLPVTLQGAAAGFAWLSVFHGKRASELERFVFLPFPRGPGLAPGADPYAPMKGSCWCLPWSKADPEPAVAILRAMHGEGARRAIRDTEGWPFYPVRARWDDPGVRRRHPFYRDAAGLVDGTVPVLPDPTFGCFHRLDVTFRNALLDDLNGDEWMADMISGADSVAPRGKPPPIRVILAGIDSRLGRARGLKTIAREMGLRPDRLRRVFRKEMGEEISEYIRKRRMDLARAMLVDGAGSVKEVAARVGYGNAAAFCRAYHAYWGHPPSTERFAAKPQAE